MTSEAGKRGRAELRGILRRSGGLLWAVFVFGLAMNLLLFTGPLFMLQVYDRVLGSGSVETLTALCAIALFLYAMMGIFEHLRARIMTRIGLRFQTDLQERVLRAGLRQALLRPAPDQPDGLSDLDGVQRLLEAPVLLALFDLPWAPLFFVVIFAFHPLVGWLALGGAGLLLLVTLANQLHQREAQAKAGIASHWADQTARQLQAEAETVQALGLWRGGIARWQQARALAQAGQLRSADISGGYAVLSKSLRMVLQSALLALGAWLVLRGALTGGAMIAGSILMGRALAPVEQLLAQWPLLQHGRAAWGRLADLLGAVGPEPVRTALPLPAARLRAEGLSVVPPGEKRAALKALHFDLGPGQALGVIGPSGAGKSTLARALAGLWPPAMGALRLDGVALAHYGPEMLCRYIGYLPQRVALFDGTIAENIARLALPPDPQKVVAAAQKAAAHEMILTLPQGYDTQISAADLRLSGGQLQRLGLARALYDDPVILVLDEPNAHLDNVGSQALNTAIKRVKAGGGAVVIMAHRPAAIRECDLLVVLDGGRQLAFGPKDEVLARQTQNAAALRQRPAASGTRA